MHFRKSYWKNRRGTMENRIIEYCRRVSESSTVCEEACEGIYKELTMEKREAKEARDANDKAAPEELDVEPRR